ncbi:MAG: thrombospondin type 3 repeat-containing protein [Candidatus Nitrosopumilus sp. bin_6a]
MVNKFVISVIFVATIFLISIPMVNFGYLSNDKLVLFDDDQDNDGIMDVIDAFDTDSEEWADFDFDGIGTNQDLDDDNDGILDSNDSVPLLVTEKLTINHMQEIGNCATMDAGTPKLLCYSKFFKETVNQNDNNSDVLELALVLTKLGAIDDCHFVSHEIGSASFSENMDVFETLNGIDGSMCRGGFYHGAMAAFFHELRENNEDISSYKTVCNAFIGSPDYTKCVHGLGHGLTHYFEYDLESTINACDQMSFYQGTICVGGVMMEYANRELTTSPSIEKDISNICSKSELRIFDYQTCSDNLGLSIAFHTDHDLEKGTKLCNLIQDNEGKEFCFRGLEREINDAKEYKTYDPTNGVRELVQPIWIKENDSNKWIVDFRSPAKISDFEYDEESKMMRFSFDKPYQIIIYISTDLLPDNFTVTVNGQIQNVEIRHGLYDNHSMIKILPTKSGIILIN